MAASLSSAQVLDLLTKALSGSHKVGDAIAMPSLLLPAQLVPGLDVERQAEPAVETWFREHGFFAERSHRGGRGYAELFRDVKGWETWDVEVLRRQYRDSVRMEEDLLAKLGVLNTEEKRRADERSRARAEEKHEERLALIQAMTEEQLDGCHEAIFELYEVEEGFWQPEFSPASGAPDLFVWHSDPVRHLWFFCEVKRYGGQGTFESAQ
jgi:hypothetical protein